MWIRLLLSCLQRKSNKPVRFIISSVDSATESTGDTAIYWESPLTPLSMATIRAASQLEKLRIHCLVAADSFCNKSMLCCAVFLQTNEKAATRPNSHKRLIFKLNSE